MARIYLCQGQVKAFWEAESKTAVETKWKSLDAISHYSFLEGRECLTELWTCVKISRKTNFWMMSISTKQKSAV